MSELDLLRPPSALDPTAPAYKDWFHLNLFDHAGGGVGLVNVSLHGPSWDARSRAVGTALFHDATGNWRGAVEIAGPSDVTVLPHGVMMAGNAIMVDPERRTLHASVEQAEEGLALRLRGTPTARPIRIEQAQPFGTGWISWYVAPRITLAGELRIGGQVSDAASWSAYHDHNWGRWFWGEDIGWEWGAFATPPPGPLFVLARLTDKLHHRCAPAQLIVIEPARTRVFPPGTVTIRYSGRSDLPLRRLPGALAALHADRADPALPATVEIEAAAGLDWVRLRFAASGAAQLIEGDPIRPGYSFIHEMVGSFEAEGRLRDDPLAATGLGVFEYVT